MAARSVVVLSILLLAGCVGPTVAVMKNPATGEVMQCKRAHSPALRERLCGGRVGEDGYCWPNV